MLFSLSTRSDGSDLLFRETYNAVTTLAQRLHSDVNFYLYCLTGARFRSEFRRLVCFWKKGDGDRTSWGFFL
jgi:hypothetical protein